IRTCPDPTRTGISRSQKSAHPCITRAQSRQACRTYCLSFSGLFIRLTEMLETLLQIGKTLRQSKRLRHHRYIKRAPSSDKKTTVVYFSLPVREDFSFNLDGISPITDEDFIKHQLYYLTYKTSGSDNQVKYLFGDINFGISQKEGYIPGTYYQLAETDKTSHKRKSSFERGDSEVASFKGSIIEKFRMSFSNDKDWIENFLRENGKQQICYLHFDFQGKHWYEFSD